MEFVIDQEIKYVNLCQHPINVLPPSGDEAEMLIVPPSGIVARCASTEIVRRTIGRFNGLDMEFGDISDLPAPEPNTILIASRLVAERAARQDVVAPGRMVTISSGERACVGLSVFA
jgi:hypothetical protein